MHSLLESIGNMHSYLNKIGNIAFQLDEAVMWVTVSEVTWAMLLAL